MGSYRLELLVGKQLQTTGHSGEVLIGMGSPRKLLKHGRGTNRQWYGANRSVKGFRLFPLPMVEPTPWIPMRLTSSCSAWMLRPAMKSGGSNQANFTKKDREATVPGPHQRS